MNAKRYHKIISGQASGFGAAVARLALSLAAFVYSFAVGVRNLLYDWKVLPRHSAPCPVISVGNVTAGGTGKTPCVIYLVRKLIARGCKPAVVTRGYGPKLSTDDVPPNVMAAKGSFGEEVALLARELPQIPVVVDANRRRGALSAVKQHGADVVVLDDGFQHRKLKRDLDVVLIDSMNPFGYEKIVPRGLLREDPMNLGRADLIILTHTDQVGYIEVTGINSRLKKFAGEEVKTVQAVHRPTGLVGVADPDEFDLEMIDGQKVLGYCAIGNPDSFRASLESLNALVMGVEAFADHHDFTLTDVERMQNKAQQLRATFIVVTTKDAVKLREIRGVTPNTVALEVQFDVSENPNLLEEALDRIKPRTQTNEEPNDHDSSS